MITSYLRAPILLFVVIVLTFVFILSLLLSKMLLLISAIFLSYVISVADASMFRRLETVFFVFMSVLRIFNTMVSTACLVRELCFLVLSVLMTTLLLNKIIGAGVLNFGWGLLVLSCLFLVWKGNKNLWLLMVRPV